MSESSSSPVSGVMRAAIERSSWIRQMFEEGNRLKRLHGDDQVFDFSLGNPSVPPPTRFREVLTEMMDDGARRHLAGEDRRGRE